MITLTTSELGALLGVSQSIPPAPIAGLAHTPEQVSGAELYVPMQSQYASSQAISTAFSRGASFAILQEIPELPGEDSARCILVPSYTEALKKIARHWVAQRPLAFVFGDYAATSVQQMLAAALLAHQRGAYAQSSDGVFSDICRIARDHEWGVFEIPCAPNACAQSGLSPQLVICTGFSPRPAESELECTHRAQLVLNSMRAEFPQAQWLVNLDDEYVRTSLQGSAFKQLSYGSLETCTYRCAAVHSFGVDGVEATFCSQSEELPFTLKVPGAYQAQNMVAALAAAQLLYPAVPLATWASELARFSAPHFRLKFVPLKNYRRAYCEIGPACLKSYAGCLELAQSFSKEGLRVALVLGEIEALPELRKKFWSQYAPIVKQIAPIGILGAGSQLLEQKASLEALGLKMYSENSPEALAQLARSLDFDILVFKGPESTFMRQTAHVLLEREGQFSVS